MDFAVKSSHVCACKRARACLFFRRLPETASNTVLEQSATIHLQFVQLLIEQYSNAFLPLDTEELEH